MDRKSLLPGLDHREPLLLCNSFLNSRFVYFKVNEVSLWKLLDEISAAYLKSTVKILHAFKVRKAAPLIKLKLTLKHK